MQLKKLRENGDTIVEVLVCLAALGFILTLTYTIASRAQQSIRSSQERTEALKLAEGQIEQLKYIAGTASNSTMFVSSTKTFCINSSAAVVDFTSPLTIEPDLALDPLGSVYPAACISGLYHVSIVGPITVGSIPSDQGGRYEVRVRWHRLGGGVNEEVKLDYELYKEN